MTRAIMFMGTGSDVGKSLIVAGLCRLLANRGVKVAPFKPQNMSNNAAVTSEGGEIGRAQALQARAARIAPSVHMNPVLLKPEAETGAQVIVQGKRHATMAARDFFTSRQTFLPAILDSFATLKQQYDLILVEGAGSPAEVNLRDGDLANMGFAAAADLPVILIGDIHRGGVIASIVGTRHVLAPDDQRRLKGFLINKFHGDTTLFADGQAYLERETGIPCLGVIPAFRDARKLPAEDAVALEQSVASDSNGTRICVLRLPRIANFDDLDPLRLEPAINLQFVHEGEAIPGDARLVIIPGSKSTVSDLASLRGNGWDIDLIAHRHRGGHILGICGGYQMLGRMIHDPDGLEGWPGTVNGLGLLDVETTLHPAKTLALTQATHVSGHAITAYEIHLGKTIGPDTARPFSFTLAGHDGAISADGRVTGTYLHGCFTSDAFRASFLASLAITAGKFDFEQTIDQTLDGLAAHLEASVDIKRLLALA